MSRFAFSLLLGLGSCQCGSVPADERPKTKFDSGGGDTVDEYRPSVYDWLPNTIWDCDWVYARSGTVNRVPHTWQFTETEFRTDCAQQIEAAYNNGDISYSAYWSAQYWVGMDEGAAVSADLHPWYGLGADVILAEFCPLSSGSCEGYRTIFHRDGDTHMVIQNGIDGDLVSSISCEKSPFSK